MRILTIHLAVTDTAGDQETDDALEAMEDLVGNGALLETIQDALRSAGVNPEIVIIEDEPSIF